MRTDKNRKIPTPDQIDAAVDRSLAKACEGKSPVYSTPESIRHGDEIIAQARINAEYRLAERIKRGEFINLDRLQEAWLTERAAIDEAVATGRLFAVSGPSSEIYYPAFFGDSLFDRGALEKVSEALGSLPATVKYYFFTTKFTSLGETPLEALRKGKVDKVLVVAAGFAES